MQAHDASSSDGPGAARYIVVWLVLVGLATVTLIASRVVPGGAGLVIAFAIAAAKAGLVLAFFMHLANGRPVHRVIFALAIGFLVLLVLGVLADVGTRSLASAYVDDRGTPGGSAAEWQRGSVDDRGGPP